MGAYLRFIIVTLGVAVAWLLVVPRPPIEQPLDYDHAKHAPMACVVCHRGVETATRAGYPPDIACLECHATPPRVRGAEAVWPASRSGPRIEWRRVNRMPDNVVFSHRRHVVLANLDCASCHGDVGKQSTPPTAPAARLDMDACESCHEREEADNDCAACHR